MDITDVFEHYTVAEDGCWNWTRGKRKGYGAINYMGRVWAAHRVAYELTKGAVPPGLSVCHRCDNPACINPEHLFVGSHGQNMQDMVTKGRDSHPPMPGERNPNAQLTAAAVIALLRDYVAGVPRKTLSARYGLRESSLSSYTDGEAWAHLHGTHGCPTLEELHAAKRRTPGARVTADQAKEIRQRLANGETGIALAAEYGLHKATISDIKCGKIWKGL